MQILHVFVKESEEIHRRNIILLTVTSSGTGIVCLGSIEDTSSEEVRLMIALNLDDELSSVLVPAPQVQSYAFVEYRESWNLRRFISDFPDLFLNREQRVQHIGEHILVPLVSENSLESGISEYVHISLHNSSSVNGINGSIHFDWMINKFNIGTVRNMPSVIR